MSGAFFHPKGTAGIQNAFTLKLCLLAGIAFAMRYVLAVLAPESYVPLDGVKCPNTEWIRASTVTPGGAQASCTFKGTHHLAWSVPCAQQSTVAPSTCGHAPASSSCDCCAWPPLTVCISPRTSRHRSSFTRLSCSHHSSASPASKQRYHHLT